MKTNKEILSVGKKVKEGSAIIQKGRRVSKAFGFFVVLCFLAEVTMILSSCTPTADKETSTPTIELVTATDEFREETATSVNGLPTDTQHYINPDYAIIEKESRRSRRCR